MDKVWGSDMILLASGGSEPGVEILNADTGRVKKLFKLPSSHSPYAMGIDLENRSIAAGTRGGLIYLADFAEHEEPSERLPTQKLTQGAPVLSVSWVGKSMLAASDTEGRCFLWRMNEEPTPRPLETSKGVICSLLSLEDGLLSGLSSSGKLLFWNVSEDRLVQAIDVPVPPPINALASLVYWPKEKALVCPNSSGELTVYKMGRDDIRKIKAHEGNFYAISLLDEDILTVGMDDGMLKIWPTVVDKPICGCKVPCGVISACAMGDKQASILLIEAKGQACTYALGKGNLRHLGRLKGKNYRKAFIADREKIQNIYARKRDQEIHEILTGLEQNGDRLSDYDIEKAHSRLTELGYAHVVLALQAEQANKKEEFVEGLRFLFSLMGVLPRGDPNSCPSMEKYAGMLEFLWHIPEAEAVCKRIMQIRPDYKFFLRTERLFRIAGVIRDRLNIIDPHISVDRIIESAAVIGKRFSGRYALKKLKPETCTRVRLNPEMIVKKYDQVRIESGEERLPAASAGKTLWLSRTGIDEIETVTMGNVPTDKIKGLQFALKVFSDDQGTVIVPALLFDWQGVPKGHSIEKENAAASRALTDIVNSPVTNLYLSGVYKALKHTLRRLITENLARREIQK